MQWKKKSICLSFIYVVWACSSRGNGKDAVCSVYMCACWNLCICVCAFMLNKRRENGIIIWIIIWMCFYDNKLLCREKSALYSMVYVIVYICTTQDSQVQKSNQITYMLTVSKENILNEVFILITSFSSSIESIIMPQSFEAKLE